MAGGVVRGVARREHDAQGQSRVQPGRVMPIHAVAPAKAIFAFQDDAGVLYDVGPVGLARRMEAHAGADPVRAPRGATG